LVLGAAAPRLGHALSPTQVYRTTPGALGLEFEAVQVTAADSVKLDGWWFPGTQDGGAIVIAGPGEGNQADLLPAVREFLQRGFSVLTFDYRGFGPRGAGQVDSLRRLVYSSSYVSDMVGALLWARARAGARAFLFAYGRGMGSAVAIAAAARTGVVEGVVADGLFNTSYDYLRWAGLEQDHVAVKLRRRHVRDEDEPVSAAMRLRAPLFAIFAERDSLMPPAEGMVAARQAKVRLDVWSIPGARHGEAPAKAPDYYDRIARYFKRLQALPKAG
jgi:pimeloyl-ACP methyl ester carboxylesterase